MKIHNVEQGSPEWLQLRAGIVTASELDSLVSPTFEIRKGDGVKTYLARKVAEAWQGGPIETYQSFDMEQGAILESEARNWFEFTHEVSIQKVGFITTDCGRFGCSPDGLLRENSGLELKCPALHTHAAYLLRGEVPKDYIAQVHGGMFATGRPEWMLVSYHRHFPKLILKVERDEAKQAVIAEALDLFYAAFNKAMKRMEEINGGPSRRRLAPLPAREGKPEKKPAPVLHALEVTP